MNLISVMIIVKNNYVYNYILFDIFEIYIYKRKMMFATILIWYWYNGKLSKLSCVLGNFRYYSKCIPIMKRLFRFKANVYELLIFFSRLGIKKDEVNIIMDSISKGSSVHIRLGDILLVYRRLEENKYKMISCWMLTEVDLSSNVIVEIVEESIISDDNGWVAEEPNKYD